MKNSGARVRASWIYLYLKHAAGGGLGRSGAICPREAAGSPCDEGDIDEYRDFMRSDPA